MKALALAGALAGSATFALAATITVSTTHDTVNGNTVSPTALKTNPGPDGISLREAITAANNAPGPHTIRFAGALAGKTIGLTSRLPVIRRPGITIAGLKTNAGLPNITINGKNAGPTGPTLFIAASSFTMSGLSFTYIPSPALIQIGGTASGLGSAPGALTDIRFTGNAFMHVGELVSPYDGFGILIRMAGTVRAAVSDVVIDNNSFSDMFEGVNLEGGGDRSVIKDVVIYRNSFADMSSTATSAVELGNHSGTHKILRTQIIQNVFTRNFIGVSLNNNGTGTNGCLIDATMLEGNVFGENGEGVSMGAGVGGGPPPAPSDNTISNTEIVNNVFTDSPSGVAIHLMDNQNGASGNTIKRVSVINNTINNTRSGPTPPTIMIESTPSGVTGVLVRNTIFWKASDGGETNAVTTSPAVTMQRSLVNQPGHVGSKGNFNADPQFVNAAAGNFRLKAASLALGAGTSTGAPADDIDCRPRGDPPAIGAYEVNATNICPKQP